MLKPTFVYLSLGHSIFCLTPPYGRHPSLKKNSMELPMEDVNIMNIFPWKYLWMATTSQPVFRGNSYGRHQIMKKFSMEFQYLFSMDEIIEDIKNPQSSIGFGEIKCSWNSSVFHTRGSDKNWNGPLNCHSGSF